MKLDFEAIIARLMELVKIPSCSFPGYSVSEIANANEWIIQRMKAIGMDSVRLLNPESDYPWIYAEKLVDPEFPTVVLYAHSDVQPEMDLSIWNSPPYEPVIQNGRLYGRGAADDKAGVLLHLETLHEAIQSQKLCFNVKLVIESEEEYGSPGLEKVFKTHPQCFTGDAVIIADSANITAGTPTLTSSLRGMYAVTLNWKSMPSALHSGLYGGAVPDVGLAMAKLISNLADEFGQLTIPLENHHFSEAQWQRLSTSGWSKTAFATEVGILPEELPWDDKAILEKLWFSHSLTCCQLQCGEVGKSGNVVQDKASCRLSLRIPPGINPSHSAQILKEAIQANTPSWVKSSLEEDGPAAGWQLKSSSSDLTNKLEKSMEKSFQKPVVYAGLGASIPIAEAFSQLCPDIDIFITGVEDPNTKAHAENESLNLEDFRKSLEAQLDFLME